MPDASLPRVRCAPRRLTEFLSKKVTLVQSVLVEKVGSIFYSLLLITVAVLYA